ncbi:MAG: FAD-dependent oxidoreductase, partial [Gillisia sp.]
MNFSYWEYSSWLSNIDFTIAGSGITGLNCALRLKERFPEANILILERGLLPNGASTKNAGFACFGSLSEILDDLESHSEAEVLQIIEQRIAGLELLRNNLGDANIDFQRHGGYELFSKEDKPLFEDCKSNITNINRLLLPIF